MTDLQSSLLFKMNRSIIILLLTHFVLLFIVIDTALFQFDVYGIVSITCEELGVPNI